jgi:hypothetical protein
VIAVASIVEGDGEVTALPILLRRMNDWKSPAARVEPLKPIRVRRDRFLNKDDEFRKQLLLAAAKCGDGGWILIVLDADDDCPAERSADVQRRARSIVPHRRVSVVMANREFEAWFIAASPSLSGFRGFTLLNEAQTDAETHRDAKGWLERQMSGSYSVMRDQPAFAARFDLDQAFAGSRSFRKLCTEWQKHVQDRE